MKPQCLKIFNLLSCLFIIALATGCSSLNAVKEATGIKSPSVSLAGMQITDLTMENVGLSLTLSIDNPNPIPITLAGFDYSLFFDGKQLLAGEKRDQLKIVAKGVSSVTLPITLNFSDLENLYQGAMSQDTLRYELKATALVDIPVLGIQKFPSTQTGEFPIPKAPDVSLSGITIEKMGLTSANIVITANIKNPNYFGIDISQLAYSLSINGSKWAESTLSDAINISEKSETKINIPLKLNFIEMGSTLYSTLTKGGGLKYQLMGNMNLNTALPMLKNVAVPFDKSGTVGVQR